MESVRAMIIAIRKRTRDIYCRKGRVQVDSNPLHIHAGLKPVASALSGRHGREKKKRTQQKGPRRESRLFMTRGGARNGNPGLFEQRAKGNVCARYGSLISLFVLLLARFIGKTHFRHASDMYNERCEQGNKRKEREMLELNYYFFFF